MEERGGGQGEREGIGNIAGKRYSERERRSANVKHQANTQILLPE